MENQSYEKETIEKQSNGKLFTIIICLCLFIIMVIGISVATFTYTKENNGGINKISTGNIYLNYTEDTNGINITNAYPMTDGVGHKEVMEPKHFTPLDKSTNLGTPAGAMLLYSDSVSKSSIVDYRLRMWVDEDTILEGFEKSFAVRVSIKAKVDLAE